MDLKQFLKPTKGKIILFLILFLLASITPYAVLWAPDVEEMYGLPFNFYVFGGGPPPAPGMKAFSEFYAHFLIIDILLWYLVSCALMVFSEPKLTK